MSERMDAKLKELATASQGEVPDLVRMRMEETLAALPERAGMGAGTGEAAIPAFAAVAGTAGTAGSAGRRGGLGRGRNVRRLAVALAVVLGLYGSGFVSPTMAGVLSKIPVVGAVFVESGDIGLKQAQLNGFATAVNQAVTDQGITLKITDVIYDGTQFAFGIAAHVPNDKDAETGIAEMDVYFPDGGYLHFEREETGNTLDWQKVGDHEYTALVQHNPPKLDLPDHFEAKVAVRQVGTTQGHWEFQFPVSIGKTKSASRTIKPNLTKQSGGWEVQVEAVHLTPSNTTVNLKLKSDLLDTDNLSGSLFTDVEVLDDQGRSLPPMLDRNGKPVFGTISASSELQDEVEVTPQFAPLQQIPKFITIRVKKDPQLEFKIPLE